MQRNLNRINKYLFFFVNIMVVAIGALAIKSKEENKKQENMATPQTTTNQIETISNTVSESEKTLSTEEENQPEKPKEVATTEAEQSTDENSGSTPLEEKNTVAPPPAAAPTPKPQPTPPQNKQSYPKSDRTTKTS